jgi:hypothetical protein
VDDNDVFEIYLVARDSAELKSVAVEIIGTLAAAEEIQILGSGVLGELRLPGIVTSTVAADRELMIVPIGAFGPFKGPSVEIVIKRTDEDETATVLRSYGLRINGNFIAALRFGAGRSNIRFNEYQVKPLADSDTTHIKNPSDPDGETRFLLSVVFYAWHFWENRFWNGRDLEEPPRLIDRLNPFVAIGLKDFGEEWFYGASFEFARGLDIVAGRHRAKVRVLDGGYQEGDVFDGDVSEIPTREQWAEEWFVGASVDLRVAVQIISGIFSRT